MNKPHLIELQGIKKVFYTEEMETWALNNIHLSIDAGEYVSISGPSGCGKSTLLNVAAGLLEPSSGTVDVFGERLISAEGVNRRAGYMFQADALMPWRTGIDNVIAGLEFRGVPRGDAIAQGEAWLRRVGLAGFGDRYPHQMSGGMRKRLALAQTLILSPDILLMDEPFSALDVQTRQLMENELLALWAEDRKSVLFITHDLAVVKEIAHDVIVMSRGEVVDSGPTAQVYANPTSDYTRMLIDAIPGGTIELAG